MAIATIFVDGFDHMADADLLTKYNSRSGSQTEIHTALSRTGGKSLRIAGSVTKIFAGKQYRTFVIGFAYRTTALNQHIFYLSVSGTSQIGFVLNSSGLLEVRRGSTSTSNGTVLATGTTVISTNAWHYLELECYIDDASGWAKVYVDEVLDISFTGDTKNSSTLNYMNEIILNSGAYGYHDDLYMRADTAEATGNTFGNCKVLTKNPQGAGTYADLTPSAGSNYQNVDETTPNGDTDYNYSNTAGHKDTYDFAALADTGSIKSVQIVNYAKKTDTGARFIESYVKSSATEQAGAQTALSTGYLYYNTCYDTDPNTAAAWTEANLDAAEFGARIQ